MNSTKGRLSLVALAAIPILIGSSAPGSSVGVDLARPPALVAPRAPAADPVAGDRPNILLIEADDMRADELRWMPLTSRLLGRHGLRFQNSFAPDPLCVPSRASLLTGEYSHNHGAISHQKPWGFHAFHDADTLATRLQDSGYRTALVGKYINGYGRMRTPEGRHSLHYVPPGWTQWWGSTDHIFTAGDHFYGGTYDYFNLVSNVNGRLEGWPHKYTTDVTSRQTQALMDRFADSSKKRPWFVYWSALATHHGGPVEGDDPGTVVGRRGLRTRFVSPARPRRVWGSFDSQVERGLGVPSNGRPEPDRSDKPAYLRSLPELDAGERTALRDISRQRAETLSVLDHDIARTLRALERTGEASNTVVVFTSDNGYYLGEHLKRQGKINLHEPSIRVPLLMSGPGIPHGVRYDPVSTIDLATTLAGLGQVDLANTDGFDLAQTITEGDQGWTRPIVIEGKMVERRYTRAARRPAWHRSLNTIGLRLGRWKLVRYSTGDFELYDLLKDPLELRSRQRDPAFRPVKRQLMALWREYVDCRGAECRAPLPDPLRLTPEQERQVAVGEQQATARYYGRA